ncbi:unnamed protein product [Protopolystoma xenopodis]|uniref:Uncharacterized protein n=1 Tax=Protopolystoma xenopodis TaxID=117903 RepID=A0A448WJE7_9PLAT|nr:unnamed protein product [Protopolystoma xenopodis]
MTRHFEFPLPTDSPQPTPANPPPAFPISMPFTQTTSPVSDLRTCVACPPNAHSSEAPALALPPTPSTS